MLNPAAHLAGFRADFGSCGDLATTPLQIRASTDTKRVALRNEGVDHIQHLTWDLLVAGDHDESDCMG
jgi:hypothetical protein